MAQKMWNHVMMRYWGSENYKLKSNPYLHRNHKNGNFKQKCCNNAKAAHWIHWDN